MQGKRETAAEAQRRFAIENAAAADRLADVGFDRLAAVYRESAREHAEQARKGSTMKTARALLLVLALAAPLPAAAQSDETCIAYMEADAAYEAAEKTAKDEHKTATEPARKAYSSAIDSALTRRISAIVMANDARDQSLGNARNTYSENQNAIRNKAAATYKTSQQTHDEIFRAARAEANAEYRQAIDRARSIQDSSKAQAAYNRADAAKRAALRQAKENLWAARQQPPASVKNEEHQRESLRKSYIERVEEIDNKAKADIDRANGVFEAAKREASAVYETVTKSAYARHDAAIDAASEALGRAYVRAYQGPTSDIQSVFQKLVLADRKRCRERFGQ